MGLLILGRIKATKSQFEMKCYPTPAPVSYAAYKLLALMRCNSLTYLSLTMVEVLLVWREVFSLDPLSIRFMVCTVSI